MSPNVRGVCHDCDRLSSGRCNQHSVEITVIPTVIVVGHILPATQNWPAIRLPLGVVPPGSLVDLTAKARG